MAACGGGRYAQASHTDRPPDRPPPRRPGRAYAAAPRGTYAANAEEPHRGETDGRSEASAAPAGSTQNIRFVMPLVNKTQYFVDIPGGPRRRAAQSNPRGYGGRGPRSSAGSGGRSMGGYYDTPPWVLCALCHEKTCKKNSSWWQTWRFFSCMSIK